MKNNRSETHMRTPVSVKDYHSRARIGRVEKFRSIRILLTDAQIVNDWVRFVLVPIQEFFLSGFNVSRFTKGKEESLHEGGLAGEKEDGQHEERREKRDSGDGPVSSALESHPA